MKSEKEKEVLAFAALKCLRLYHRAPVINKPLELVRQLSRSRFDSAYVPCIALPIRHLRPLV